MPQQLNKEYSCTYLIWVSLLDVCQLAVMYNVQKAKVEKERHWPQRLHRTIGDKSQTEYLPIHLLWSTWRDTSINNKINILQIYRWQYHFMYWIRNMLATREKVLKNGGNGKLKFCNFCSIPRQIYTKISLISINKKTNVI